MTISSDYNKIVYGNKNNSFTDLSRIAIFSSVPHFARWLRNPQQPLEELIDRLAQARFLISGKLHTGSAFGQRRYHNHDIRYVSSCTDLCPLERNTTPFFAHYNMVSERLDTLSAPSDPFPISRTNQKTIYQTTVQEYEMQVDKLVLSQEELWCLPDFSFPMKFNYFPGPPSIENDQELLDWKSKNPELYRKIFEKLIITNLSDLLSCLIDTPLHHLDYHNDCCEILTFRFGRATIPTLQLTRYFRIIRTLPDGKKHKFPFVALHQDRLDIPTTLSFIEEVIKKAKTEHDSGNLKGALAQIAIARYLLAHAMPWNRGSAAIGEWLETILFRALGYAHFPFQQNSNIDLDAFSMTIDQFIEYYQTNTMKIIAQLPKN